MMRNGPAAVAAALLSLLGLAAAGSAAAQDGAVAQQGSGGSKAAEPGAAPAAPAAVTDAAAAADDPALAAEIEAGHKLYLKNCRTCHGSKGTAGVPLAGNIKVQGGYGYLVWAIITGPGYMPEFGPALSDEEIAGIATYVLNSWGNDYGLVTAQDVKEQR